MLRSIITPVSSQEKVVFSGIKGEVLSCFLFIGQNFRIGGTSLLALFADWRVV